MVQYIVLILVNSVAMILTKKTDHYPRIMPWILTIMQLCELPLLPVLPVWYTVMISVWLFCTIFFQTILPLQTLYQAIPLFLVLLICLPTRIFILLASSVDSAPVVLICLYVILGLLVCVNFTIDVVGTRQCAQNEAAVAKKECDQFRTMFNTFPEAVMICKLEEDNQLAEVIPKEDADNNMSGADEESQMPIRS